MLNEHEQRTLAEIESTLGDDPAFVRKFTGDVDHGQRTAWRRMAIALGVLGVIGTFFGLRYASVAVSVVTICAVGVAAGIWTWPIAKARRPLTATARLGRSVGPG